MYNILFTDRTDRLKELKAALNPSEISVDYCELSPFRIKEYCYDKRPVAIVFDAGSCDYSDIVSYVPEDSKDCPYFIILHNSADSFRSSDCELVIDISADESCESIAKKIRILSFEKFQKMYDVMEDTVSYSRKLIRRALDDLCFSATYTGYEYISTILEKLCLSEFNMNDCLCKVIYPDISKKYNVSCASIERNIRTVIGKCWLNSAELVHLKYFGQYYSRSTKIPSNREFLLMLSDVLKRDIEKYKREKYGEYMFC